MQSAGAIAVPKEWYRLTIACGCSGLLPLWYGQPRNHGCPLVFVMSMYGALELGAFDYARGVLDNWLHYFIRKRGMATPEGVSSGADLWAMYADVGLQAICCGTFDFWIRWLIGRLRL